MRRKIIDIFVCMLMIIAAVIPFAMTRENSYSKPVAVAKENNNLKQTYCNCNNGLSIKWEQLPNCPNCTGIHIDNHYAVNNTAADDFLCTSPGPITGITLWGSNTIMYGSLWYTEMFFTLSIYSDISAISSPTGYSMPWTLLWTKSFNVGDYTASHYCDCQDEWFWDPYKHTVYSNPLCEMYQFDFNINPSDAFVQNGTEEDPVIYWLVVYARMGRGGGFCWETSLDHWNDNAVFKAQGYPTWVKLAYPKGHPDEFESIDMAFRITTSGCCDITIDLKPGYLGNEIKADLINNCPNNDLYNIKWEISWSSSSPGSTGSTKGMDNILAIPVVITSGSIPPGSTRFGYKPITVTVTADCSQTPVIKTGWVIWLNIPGFFQGTCIYIKP